jgi:hypothetical protein
MKPNSSISKGKRLEKFVIQQIEEAGLGKATRTPGSGSGKIKSDIFSNLKFSLECKNEKQVNILKNIDQAKRDCEKGNAYKEKWCLVTRDPRHPEFHEVYATIPLWEFLTLLKKESEPRIKEPDRSLKWKLTKLKDTCNQIIREL